MVGRSALGHVYKLNVAGIKTVKTKTTIAKKKIIEK